MSNDSIGALFDECYSIVELHATFTQGLQKAHANYIQEVKKRIKGPRFVEPPIALPNPPNIDNPPHLRSNSSAVVGSSEPPAHTPPGANPRGRPARGAALRARQGVTDSYKFMSTTKLRRPSNFDSTKRYQPMPSIPGTPANLDIGLGAAPTEPNRVAPGPSSSKDVFKIPPLPAAPAASRSSKRPSRSKAKENSSLAIATGDISSSEDSGSEAKGLRRSNRGRASKRKNTNQIQEVDRRSRSRVSKVTVNSVTHLAESEDSSDSPNELKQTFKKSRFETGSSTMVNGADIEFIEPNVTLEPADANSHKARKKTIRKNKVETGSSTMVNGADIEFIEPNVPLEPADTNSHKTRTKTIRKNKVDTTTTLNVDNTVSLVAEPMDVTRTRTKTLTKNKSDTTTTLNVDNTVSLVAEPMDVTRTRTKTLTKNKSDTTTTLNVDNTVSLVVEPMDVTRTRTKTLTKNKSAEESSKLGSTYCVASTADLGPAAPDSKVAAATDDPEKTVEMLKTFRRSKSCPKNNTITRASHGETFKVPDPMDTLDLPGGSQYFTSEQDSKKRHNACDIPDVKRRKSGDDPVEQLVGVVLQNAPRTRSKMKAIAESRARSAESRTPGQGKENSGILPINFIIGSVAEGVKPTTPLATLNMISPKAKTTGSAARNKPARFLKEPIKEIEKAKLAEARRKEEALKKKQELMQLKKQEIRNQRETKIKKVAESRKAVEKEKMLQLEKEKKEREEKEKQAKAEMIRQREEALLKKKLLNQQKAQEAEERRQKEEQLRLAKLREQEEEQRKATEARHRQLEEAERLAALRKQQQKEEEMAKLLEKEKAKEKAKHTKAAKDVSDPDDYGIDDDDGDETETKPRRPIPKWAEKEERTKQLQVQTSLPLPIVRSFFNVEPRAPNLREIFGREAFIRPRTSSAVWATPPPPPPGLDP